MPACLLGARRLHPSPPKLLLRACSSQRLEPRERASSPLSLSLDQGSCCPSRKGPHRAIPQHPVLLSARSTSLTVSDCLGACLHPGRQPGLSRPGYQHPAQCAPLTTTPPIALREQRRGRRDREVAQGGGTPVCSAGRAPSQTRDCSHRPGTAPTDVGGRGGFRAGPAGRAPWRPASWGLRGRRAELM